MGDLEVVLVGFDGGVYEIATYVQLVGTCDYVSELYSMDEETETYLCPF